MNLSPEGLEVGLHLKYVIEILRNDPAKQHHPVHPTPINTLTVGFLVSRSRSWSSKLLRLRAPVVCHQQRPIVRHQSLLQLILSVFVHVFLVVCNDRLGNGLTNRVDLRSVTAARDPNADVDIGKFIETNDEEGFVDLE